MLKEILRDTTALGGIAVYGFIMLLFLITGKTGMFIALFIALALCYAVIAGIRLTFFRARPKKQKYKGILTKFDAGSFPSMHSARIGVLAFVLWPLFPQASFKILLLLAVLGVLSTRVMLKRHYFSDVIAGAVLGLLIGWVSVALAGLA